MVGLKGGDGGGGNWWGCREEEGKWWKCREGMESVGKTKISWSMVLAQEVDQKGYYV